MILSHWDYDHYAMARKNGDAWRCRWIAPQQVMGSVSARELYVRLLVEAPNGGALALWPDSAGGGPTHWPVSFGFIERGTGAPVNADCLAVHVRLQDDAAIAPAPDAVSATFAHRIKPLSPLRSAWGRAIIVDTGYKAVWIDDGVGVRFKRRSVVIPLSSGLFVAQPPPLNPGSIVLLTAINPAVIGSIRSHWIPAVGLASPKHAGGIYVPVLPNGQAWMGGWAISPSDYVSLGGCIVDFPKEALKNPVGNVMGVSPPPGTVWAPPGAKRKAPVTATWLTPTKGMWRPVWGGGYWAIPLPAAQAAALLPLPSGPVAILPVSGFAPVSAAERYVLLPGDAGYQHLPSMQARLAAVGSGKATQSIVGMLATHHGSASWIPKKNAAAAATAKLHVPPAGGAKIVYSYGTRIGGTKPGAHCYDGSKDGHPQAAAIAAYLAVGWGVPAAPVAFSFNRLNTAPYDFASNQPFNPLALGTATQPKVANGLGHFNGNVALGLIPATVKSVVHTCPYCSQVRRYYF